MDYDGVLFSPATANSRCSYCGADLRERYSMRIESEEDLRFVCTRCLIGIFDAVAGIKKKKK